MVFNYTPLEEGQFRLLTILQVTDGLFCELENFALEITPGYDAISYAWGPEQ